MCGPASNPFDRGGADLQALTPHRMLKVGACLVEGPKRTALRHRAGSKAGTLREDEPHPVAAFVTRGQLLQRPVKGAVLRVNEPLEVKRVRHPVITPPARGRSAACGLPYAVNGDDCPVARMAADPFTVIAIRGCTVGAC